MTEASQYGLSKHIDITAQILTHRPATKTQTYTEGPESLGVWTLRLDVTHAILRIALGGNSIDVVATIQLWQPTGWTLLDTYPVPRPAFPLAGPQQASHALQRSINYATPLVAAIAVNDFNEQPHDAAENHHIVPVQDAEAAHQHNRPTSTPTADVEDYRLAHIILAKGGIDAPTPDQLDYAAVQVSRDQQVARCIAGEASLDELPDERQRFAQICQRHGYYLMPTT